MKELRRISGAELRQVIKGAKARHSGAILIETPAALEFLGAAAGGQVLPGRPGPDGGYYWLQSGGVEALPALLSALGRGPAPSASGIAPAVQTWQREHALPRFRDGSTSTILEEVVRVLVEASGHGVLVVEFGAAEALTVHVLHMLRYVLDHSDGIRAVFLVRFGPPGALDPERAAAWGRAVTGLLDLCVKCGMWNRAGIVLDELMRHLHALPDAALRGHVLFRSGMAAVRQGRSRDAEGYYERAIEQLVAAGDDDTLVKALNNLGNLMLGEGRLEEAEARFARALRLGEELQSDYHLAVSYGNYARLWLARARPDQAEAQVRKSILFTVRSGYYHHAHYTYATLGDVYAQRGEAEEAERMLRRAVAICERQESPVDTAQGLARLGRFLLDQGRLEDAAGPLATSEELFQRTGSGFGRLTIAENRAALRLAQRDTAGARAAWTEAERVARELANGAALYRLAELRRVLDAAQGPGARAHE